MPMEMLIALAALVVLISLGLRVVPESQRLAVMRLGRYVGLLGPGVVFVLPFIDRVTRLNLDRDIPGWRGLSEEQLREAVLQRLSV
jgi:regulator of protease activity HflC (stomatin/prohibitin superfamily)